jgi:predicted nucleotidyltransferase
MIPAGAGALADLGEGILVEAARAVTGKPDVEQKLSRLVQRLQSALGTRLVSVTLYGSAATGDWQEKTSDLNVLCVLSQLSVEELGTCEPIFRWWEEDGNLSPLLLTVEEVRTSTDCFPMEFSDMREHRTVLYGEDVIEGLEIDRSFYRAQVEHELRSKHIRLRQKAADILSVPDKLSKLLTDSLSTFCVLGRHALLLSGHEARFRKAEILAALERAMGRQLEASSEVLALRSAPKQPSPTNARMLFKRYLEEMESLVRFVDALDK